MAPRDPPSLSAAERLEQQAAAAALRKMQAGQKPTRAEAAALKRVEKAQEERRRWEYYESIPQKHWREMSGRQTKVLHEQAERYGIPFGGRTINLPDVVRALHSFLKENALRLAYDESDPMMSGLTSPALEEYRRERAALARLDRLEREQELVDRATVRTGFGRVAALLREAGETLQTRYGADAAQVLIDALENAQRELSRVYGDTDEEHAEAGDSERSE